MKTHLAIIPGIIIASAVIMVFSGAVFSKSPPPQPNGVFTVENEPLAAEVNAASCRLSKDYPVSILQWCALIDSVADELGLDSNVIAAVMLQESGGDSSVISSSGAVGLLQVMPSDGIAASFVCQNGPCFHGRPRTEQLLDPEFNIRYGATFLASLVTQTGDLREALKKYGPYDRGYDYADRVLAILNRHR